VFGTTELERLRVQKQALILESSLNRQALSTEYRELRMAVTHLRNAALAPRRLVPLLALLAPLVGFGLVRGIRHPVSLFSRLVSAAKWIGPLYSLWRGFSAARK
jgi:hypothetical protein